MKIVWISGHYSLVYAYPPIQRQQDVTNYDKMSQRISGLWHQGFSDKQIAAKLSSEGYRSARSLRVSSQTVLKIRHKHGWHFTRQRRKLPKVDGYLTTRELASLLGVSRAWVSRRINSGTIDTSYMSRYPKGNMHLIQDDPKLIEQLQQLISERRST